MSSSILSLQLRKLQKWDIVKKKILSPSPQLFEYNFTNRGERIYKYILLFVEMEL
ncbi:winged helix-turn-helix transcriptional regulator [Methanobacterium sp.]|uniref:winged helix-turn-helix transcriptional regulator n=1 Tax=Methanobacterium sp. TaxID=2164 RepID=UPI003C738E40